MTHTLSMGKKYGDSVVALFKDAEGETTFTKSDYVYTVSQWNYC